MSVETGGTLMTRRELALAAAEVPEQMLEEFVTNLPAEKVVYATARVKDIRKSLQRLEDALETRIGLDKLVGEGGWRDPESGEEYVYAGTPTWAVPDAHGLRAALETAGVSSKDLGMCFETTIKVSHTGLNRLRDYRDDLASIIRDFRTRKFGPRHLRKRDDER